MIIGQNLLLVSIGVLAGEPINDMMMTKGHEYQTKLRHVLDVLFRESVAGV